MTYFEQDNILGRERRAALLLTRGILLQNAGRPESALKAALESVQLRKGVMGAEIAYAASLHAALHSARELNDPQKVAELQVEIAAVEQLINDEDSLLRRRIVRAQGDPSEDPEQLLADIIRVGNPEYLYMWHVGRTIGQWKAASPEELLGHLDEAQRILDATPNLRNDRELQEILSFAYGQVHLERGDHARAIDWYRRTLELNPLERVWRCLRKSVRELAESISSFACPTDPEWS